MIEKKIIAGDGLELALRDYRIENPKGIFHIIHGASEHKKRYDEFCKFLASSGYAAVISDTRGHGESINNSYPIGHVDSLDQIIGDMKIIRKYIEDEYPGVPVILFGHSFGSMISRKLIQDYDDAYTTLILSGAPNYVGIIKLGLGISKLITAFTGGSSFNKIITGLNKVGHDDSWLSYNELNKQEYAKDPLCGFKYTNNGNITMFTAVDEIHNTNAYKFKNPDLRILFISGIDDPITGGKNGLNDSIESLKKVGYSEIVNIVYPNMKHEILNEDNRIDVYKDIIEFLS